MAMKCCETALAVVKTTPPEVWWSGTDVVLGVVNESGRNDTNDCMDWNYRKTTAVVIYCIFDASKTVVRPGRELH